MRPSPLNHRQKLDIIDKVNHGWKASGILRYLKEQGYCLTLATIKTIIRKYKTGNFEIVEWVTADKTNFNKITYGHVVLIQQILENDPLQSSQDIQTKLDCGISRTTVLRAVRYAGWTSAKPRYCSMVREANQLKRAAFCEKLITDNERFSDCIFSDECTIQLHDNKLSCFRRIDGAAANIPTPKHPLKIHLWGAISRRGRSPLLMFDGIMEKVFYTNSILDSVLVPFIQTRFPDSHRFVQDNDPKHTSNYAKDFMTTNDINWWKWPAESPDLNPNEMVWSMLKKDVAKRRPQTKDQLMDYISEFWAKKLTKDTCNTFIDHIYKVAPVVKKLCGRPSGDLPNVLFRERSEGKSIVYFTDKLETPEVKALFGKKTAYLNITERDENLSPC